MAKCKSAAAAAIALVAAQTAIATVVIGSTACAEPAPSDVATNEVWACGRTASWGNGATFMTRYEVKGNVLLSGNERQPDQVQYQILANNRVWCGSGKRNKRRA